MTPSINGPEGAPHIPMNEDQASLLVLTQIRDFMTQMDRRMTNIEKGSQENREAWLLVNARQDQFNDLKKDVERLEDTVKKLMEDKTRREGIMSVGQWVSQNWQAVAALAAVAYAYLKGEHKI